MQFILNTRRTREKIRAEAKAEVVASVLTVLDFTLNEPVGQRVWNVVAASLYEHQDPQVQGSTPAAMSFYGVWS